MDQERGLVSVGNKRDGQLEWISEWRGRHVCGVESAVMGGID